MIPDDPVNPVSPASNPEIREDFGSASRSGGALPVYADFETEKAVLASLLAEPETLQTVLPLLGSVQPADDMQAPGKKKKTASADASAFHQAASIMFRDPKHALVYEAILEVNATQGKFDILTVADCLQKTNRLTAVGGMDFLMELQTSIASSANIEGWCSILRDCAMLREIIRTCSNALDICRNPEKDVRATLDAIENSLFQVRNSFTKTELKSFNELLKGTIQFFSDILANNVATGILTGFADLDRLTGGLRRQEMFVLAARPSIGKTAIALNIVRNIIMKEVAGQERLKVAFFSLEMSAEQVTQRLLCTESKVPLSKIMQHRMQQIDVQSLSMGASRLKKAQLTIDPTGGLSVFELRAKARKLKETNGLDLIVVDYLTLMRAEVKAADGRQVEVAAISGGLKKIAKDLDVPVLVLAQLNRDIEKGQGGKNARPKLSNLRESGAIEQDADVVVFLHRDRDETKDVSEEAQNNGVKAELIVEKNRNGATGLIDLLFFPQLMEFRSVEHKYGKSDEAV